MASYKVESLRKEYRLIRQLKRVGFSLITNPADAEDPDTLYDSNYWGVWKHPNGREISEKIRTQLVGDDEMYTVSNYKLNNKLMETIKPFQDLFREKLNKQLFVSIQTKTNQIRLRSNRVDIPRSLKKTALLTKLSVASETFITSAEQIDEHTYKVSYISWKHTRKYQPEDFAKHGYLYKDAIASTTKKAEAAHLRKNARKIAQELAYETD